jgi:hypothetical protein
MAPIQMVKLKKHPKKKLLYKLKSNLLNNEFYR